MADVHNEDLISDLTSALSKVREALDTTVKIEQNPSMSVSDRNSNIAIVKAAVISVIDGLQSCGSESFLGTAAPDSQMVTFRVIGNDVVSAGSVTETFVATADFMDHNGLSTATNEKVSATWFSSDSGIVSVNSSTGVYSALVPGNVTITARHSGGAVASVPLVVI